jgi:hypothetical protein
MAESNNLLKEKAQLLERIRGIQAEQGKEAAKLDGAYQIAASRLKEIVKIIKASEVAQENVANSVDEMVTGAQSLGSVYSRIKTQQLEQADISANIANSLQGRIDSNSKLSNQNATAQQQASSILTAYGDQASIAREMSQLTSEDVEQKAKLQSDFDAMGQLIQEELDSMDKRLAVTKDFMAQQGVISDSVKNQINDAQELSSLSTEQKSILEQQAQVFDSMKNKVDALGSTLTTFLKRPQAAIGALVIGIGKFAGKFGEVNRELGQSFTQGLNSSTLSATGLGFIFEDTAGTVRELASEFGGVDAATLSTQTNIGLMASNMGITNKEAVGLTASFARLNGSSNDVAADMIKTTQEFANQNGIIPGALMADLAGSTEEFALFGKDGGKNILEAAGYAAKLGVNMSTLSGIADNLLDFESSITKELELGAMLGKNINLDKARQLAYQNDIEGATKATLDELGGIEAFNKMDYFQKKATADLLGISVAEMQKMATNSEKAGKMGEVMSSSFSKAGEFLDTGLNKYLGTGLEGLGGMITMTGQVGTGFSAMGTSIGGAIKGTGQLLKNIMGMVAGPVLKGLKSVGGAIANSGIGKKVGEKVGGIKDKLMSGVKDKFSGGGDASPKKGGGMPGKGIMDGMAKIDMKKVLQGAAAMVIVAGAVFIFGKAVQEFMKVSWEAVGMAVVSMLALVGAVALLGAIMMSGVGAVAILAGAAAMLVVASAVLVLGIGLQAIGTGFEMLGAGISSLTPNLLAVGTSILGMVTLLPMIGLLSLGLIALAGSLAYLALFGTAALPVLMGLGVAMMMAGLGVTMLGKGLSLVGAGLKTISDSISGIGDTISGVGTVIGNIVTFIGPIMALSLALTALAASLMLVSVAGITALPGLLAIAAVGAIAVGISGLFGGDDETADVDTNSEGGDSALITEIKGLRADLIDGKVGVYMDGTKVTAAISKVVDKVGSNSYAI